MELENQNEQPSVVEDSNDEVFFFEDEDSSDVNNHPELEKKYKELNKKFTQTSQENSQMKKDLEVLKEKAWKYDELSAKEAEKARESEVKNFANNYQLSESVVKAISDLQKWSEKSLEEIATEYGFLQEAQVSAATSRNPKWRSFVLPNSEEEKTEISKEVMRKFWYKTSEEVDKIRAEFGI